MPTETLPPSHIPVLDTGFVAPIPLPNSDLKVVNAARVSFGKQSLQFDPDRDARLITYLARHNHWTPFGHCRTLALLPLDTLDEIQGQLINTGGFEIAFPREHPEHAALACSLAHLRDFPSLCGAFASSCPASVKALYPDFTTIEADDFEEAPFSIAPHLTPVTLHFKMPLAIYMQWDKSRVGFVTNMISRRYVDSPPDFHTPSTWRSRPEGNIKQGSGPNLEGDVKDHALQAFHSACMWTKARYHNLLMIDAAPEQARFVLPLSTYTEFWMTGSLRSWARLVSLRMGEHVQAETKAYAHATHTLLSQLHPVTWPGFVSLYQAGTP